MCETPASPWIHIGECPVCVNGLCRVRTCQPPDQRPHFYAMCDECEALWLEPSTDTPRSFPDSCDPRCPICSAALYGEQSHWSHAEELIGTEWLANSIFDVPNADSFDSNSLAIFPDDPSYGQDEPKPGC